jgi:hypothetical protein
MQTLWFWSFDFYTSFSPVSFLHSLINNKPKCQS